MTRNPKLQAGKELYLSAKNITELSENEFLTTFEEWETKWVDFLNERTKNKHTGKTYFTHKKLRSAWRSLKNNFGYLFVFEKYKELDIPNTTNDLEGSSGALKKAHE